MQSSFIPLVQCIHSVHTDDNGFIFGDCCVFETNRIFCIHMVCVCDYVCTSSDESFTGLTHRSQRHSLLMGKCLCASCIQNIYSPNNATNFQFTHH